MKPLNVTRYVLILWIAAILFPLAAWAEEKLPAPETYMLHPTEFHEIKSPTDDPRDLTVTFPLKDIIPPEIWDKINFDQEKMKKGSVELLGFTAPELVGKIAPEIKPGKYTYKDVEQNPALKELFPPEFVMHIRRPVPRSSAQYRSLR